MVRFKSTNNVIGWGLVLVSIGVLVIVWLNQSTNSSFHYRILYY
jgi:hypothetical protein